MLYAFEWNEVICYNKENKNEHESHGQERICIKQLVDVTSFAFFKKTMSFFSMKTLRVWCFHFFAVSGYQ